ncbi:winged helix DNA-binding domain-containing protein [Streptomyces profundus]|uniref:winged helix DNA-binding domain-containing protein n=1 Tax=Streptomyces profundus TaxID=2867410 RepID=UPI001D16756D|nr:winged helix DNA-binding domain-containing protein [Streptomyces sp. MA3_2.13]UED83946.1 winged helix DNA-binding domain-containing protein [Streptomyces sp. MA3_2.13]
MSDLALDAPELSWADVVARRMERHGLSAPSAGAPVPAVVRAMCGAHAQVLSAAELSVGLRTVAGTRADVRRALWEERSLVKTFGPRGTVHLLPTEELPLWTGALSAVPAGGGLPASARMSAERTDAVVAAIGRALADVELVVEELSDAVIAEVGAWAGELVMPAFGGMWPRWRQALHTAAHRGVLCFGADRGRRVTYTNPRRWLPGFRPGAPDAALAELVRRFLWAYGPATPQQFARWLAAPRRWTSELFASLADELRPVRLAGETAFLVAGDDAPPVGEPSGLRLLPYFDAYGVGGHPRELLFPGRARERALARGQAGNMPVVLIDGVVRGIWHQRRAGARLSVTVEPFEELTARLRRELGDQVERVGAILEARPTLTLGVVPVGPHA